MIDVIIVPVREDNYSYILIADNGETAVVDPGEATPVIDELEKRGLKANYIFTTHHHADHIEGNAEIKNHYGAKIAGPASEQARIPEMDILLDENTPFTLGGENVQILETPGHTRGHICFYFPESQKLFSGDTLFLLGCGRLFEGTAEQMWHSLEKIIALPDDTLIYCGHEYTSALAKFNLHIEPDNPHLKMRYEEIKAMRKHDKPTVPATLALEKKTNVFLRAGSAEKFADIRKAKDDF